MKKNRLIVLLLAFVMAFSVFALAACGDDDKPKGDSTNLTLSTKTLSVKEGEDKEITVTYNGTDTISYVIANTEIATVTWEPTDSKKATVSGVQKGTTTLTVTAGKKSATCAITVTEKDATLTLSDSTLEIYEGDTEEITATYDGKKTLTYTIDKTDIATVAKDADDHTKATITAVKAGTATLTVSDGTVSKTCEITVIGETVAVKNGEDEITKLYLKADGTATLTAEGSKGSAVTEWTSSNPEVATVSNGSVTAVAIGYSVITAKVSDDVKAELPLWVTPEDYTLTFSENENGKDVLVAPDKWYFWNDQNWVSSNVTVSSSKFENNAAQIAYTATGACDFGLQFFYKNTDINLYDYYKLDAIVTSAIDTQVTFNKEVYQLTAGVPTKVTANYVEPSLSSISIQVKVADKDSNTISVGDVVFTKLPQAPLTAPSFTLADPDNTITIAPVEAEAEKVEKYEVGLFGKESGTLAYIIEATTGKPLTTSGLAAGEYTVRLRAIPTDLTVDGASTWSETNEIITLGDTGTNLECGSSHGEDAAIKAPGTWQVYSDGGASDAATLFAGEEGSLGTIVLNHKAAGANFWSTQIFMECKDVTANAKYRLTMTITSSVATTIKVRDIEVVLEADKAYTFDEEVTEPENTQGEWGMNGASILIVIGKDSAAPAGTYTFSNVKYTPVTAEETEA